MNRQQKIDDLTRKLQHWNHRLDELEERAQERTDDLKDSLQRRRADLEEKKQKLESRLADARDAASTGWERTSRDLDRAWEDLQRAGADAFAALGG